MSSNKASFKEAAIFRAWAAHLYPWMLRVDLERLAVWLAKHDRSQAWTCDYEDLRKNCL
jgi:hypothetical protein